MLELQQVFFYTNLIEGDKMDEFIYLGKIVNTHGIKGELRIISNFKYKEKAFSLKRKLLNILISPFNPWVFATWPIFIKSILHLLTEFI